MAPPLCRYWAKAGCRNGENCRFDHPRDLPRNQNRFAGFHPNDDEAQSTSGRSPGDGDTTASVYMPDSNMTLGRSTPQQKLPYALNKDQIIADLSTERPQWILSAYGPGSKAPAQLFGGPMREQSFEEMRLYYYQGVASGSENVALQEADSLVRNAEAQMQNAINDIDGAIKFICTAPFQTSAENGASAGLFSKSPFDMNMGVPNPPVSEFGQPSALGARLNPFGGPPRDQNQNPGFTNFNRPTDPFAAPQLHLGQPLSQPWTNPIGTAVTAGIFTNSPAQQNPFGAISQVSQTAPMTSATAAGSSNFPGYAALSSSPNPFSQRSATTFETGANPFARTSQEGHSNFNGTVGAPPATNHAGLAQPPLESYTTRGPDGRLRTFKGNQVIYKDGEAGFHGRGGAWEKIWFPDGPPAPCRDTELDESFYTADVVAAYAHLMETGSFKDGVMPFIPPKREWCRWDF